MRIDRLDLIAYGHFTDKSLDLAHGNAGLHIIYGDNEAGKSTSLRALIGLLFGIPARTKDNFLHSNTQLRIGGKLRLSDNREIEFLRRKGTKNTLLQQGTDDPLEENALAPFIPSTIDEKLFTRLWGIDYDRLVEGGRELLDQSGDLGRALFSAAVGTSNLQETLTTLRNSADDLFKPRASKTALNQAIILFKDAQKRTREAVLPVAEWKKLQNDLSELNTSISNIEADIEEVSKAKNQLDRIKRMSSVLVERDGILEKLSLYQAVLLLPEDFEEKRNKASATLQTAIERKSHLELNLTSLRQEAKSLNIRNDLLDSEETILSIYKELGAVEKAFQDRPRQDGVRRSLRNEAETLLKGVRPDIKLTDADTLRPLLNNKKWISGLNGNYHLLTQRKRQAISTIKDIEDERKLLQDKINSATTSGVNLKELKSEVSTARKAGNLEQRLSESKKQTAGAISSIENEFIRLGRFNGTRDSLLNLALPEAETIDTFEKENDALSEKIKDLIRVKQNTTKERIETERALKALLMKNDVLSIGELEESRTTRDGKWQLIKSAYIDKNGLKEKQPDDLSASDLSIEYEKTVVQADHISDRLRLEADQVIKRVDLESRLVTLNSQLDDLENTTRQVNINQKEFEARWSSIWKPLKIDPGTPREMKQWLLKVDKLVEKIQALNALERTTHSLADEWHRLKESISLQIEKFDSSIDTRLKSLESLLSFCEERIESEESMRDTQRQIELSLKELAIRQNRTQDELKSIETDLSSWSLDWSKAIEGLGLTADDHPEHAIETFDRLESFFDKFDKSEELRKRIYGIDQVKETFENRVITFVESIGHKPAGQEASIIAARLHRDLNTAREDRASAIKIEARIREITEEIKDAEITIQHATQQLTNLRELAKVKSDEALMEAGEQSNQKRHLQEKLTTVEQELTRGGDGLSINELEEEAATIEIDTIEGKLDKTSFELKTLQDTRDTLRDQRLTIQNEIKAKDGAATAAKASEDAEEQLASITSYTEQYLRLQIAALILEQRIETYRKANQAPVLARAGQLFSKLTLGSYEGLRDELDESGKPILLGVRPNNKEVAIDGMSDGSRDQLFLSLRLATLEQHLKNGEPMPFIVDDILIGFDDNRSKVCLDVLGELATRTQVLLFTHHSRILDLAADINTSQNVFTHALS